MRNKLVTIVILLFLFAFNSFSAESLFDKIKMAECFNLIYSYKLQEADSLATAEFKATSHERFIIDINIQWYNILSNVNKAENYKKITATFQALVKRSEQAKQQSQKDIFLILYSGIFKLRCDAYFDEKFKALDTYFKLLPNMKYVLKHSNDCEEYRLMAGMYNYAFGSIKQQHPILATSLIFFPKSDMILGQTQLNQCLKSDFPVVKTEACYFLYKTRSELNKDYAKSEYLIVALHNQYSTNPLYAIELLKTSTILKSKAITKKDVEAIISGSRVLSPVQKSHFLETVGNI